MSLSKVFGQFVGRSRAVQSGVRRTSRAARPWNLERLEDRLAPALDLFDINLSGAPVYDRTIVVGDTVYFADTSAETGWELRAYDSTTNTANWVADINPLPGGDSYVGQYGFALAGTKLFFSAYDPVNGYELRWLDTALPSPTIQTLDVNPGPASSNAGQHGGFSVVGNKLYFSADDATSGVELRCIDATSPNPTVQTLDIASGTAPSNPGQYGGFTLVGNKLYFSATDSGSGVELRWIDVTLPSPTLQTLNINAGSADSFAGQHGGFVSVGNKLYFSAIEPTNGMEPRWIDTTLTTPVLQTVNISAGNTSSNAGQIGGFTAVGNKLYFAAADSASGTELRWIDTAAAPSTFSTLDIRTGDLSSSVGTYGGFIASGSKLYFSAMNWDDGHELMGIDTTLTTPTLEVLNINDGSSDHSFAGQYGGFKFVGNRLYFTASDAFFGAELRWFDTTTAPFNIQTLDIAVGTPGSNAGQYGGFTVVGNKLLFMATASANVTDLRWLDTTSPFPVVNTIDFVPGAGGSNPGEFTAFVGDGYFLAGTRMFFAAEDADTGCELRWFDTALANPTVQSLDINPGSAHSSAGYKGFAFVGTKLYFGATSAAHGNELRWVDTAAATPVVQTLDFISGSDGFEPQNLVAVGTKLYFTAANTSGNDRELRWIDTTVANPTVQTLDIYPGKNPSSPQNLTPFGDRLYFSASRPTVGTGIAWIDTTLATPVLHTFAATTWIGATLSKFNILENRLFYVTGHISTGGEPHWIDLTAADPTLNTFDINPGIASSEPAHNSTFKAFGSKLYFSAKSAATGDELRWIDAAQPIPTVETFDLVPGTGSGFGAGSFTAVGNKLYLSASTPAIGTELFWIDMTAATPTALSLDIAPSDPSNPAHLTAIGTKLYFVARESELGSEIRWIDTTTDAPILHTLDVKLVGGSSPDDFHVVGTKLYFDANDHLNGREVRWIDIAIHDPTLGLTDTNAGANSANPGQLGGFEVAGNNIYFTAGDPAVGAELRWIDTTLAQGAVQTLDIVPGSAGSNVGQFGGSIAVGNRLFFSSNNAATGTELRWIDRTVPNSTVETLDIYPGTNSSSPGQFGGFIAMGTRLYFVATDAASGTELRWIDTSLATPTLNTVDLWAGGDSINSLFGGFYAIGTKLFFTAQTTGAGWELRSIDTALASLSVKTWNINSGSSDSLPGLIGGFTAVGSKLFFSATDSSRGNELRWLDTALASPTVQSLDVYAGSQSSNAGQNSGFVAVGTKLFFAATDLTSGTELRWIDTTLANPVVQTLDIVAGNGSSFPGQYGGLKAAGTKLFFTATDAASGTELRWIDASLANPTLNTIDIFPGAGSSNAGQFGGFTLLDQKLFFTANDGVSGAEPRWLDLLADVPTVQTLDDIYSGPGSSNAGEFGGFVAAGLDVYFAANKAGFGYELFRYQAPAPPQVTSITPAIGPTTGGVMVIITGVNFVSVSAVTFAGVPLALTSYTVDSPSQITATVPAHPAGLVDIQVVTPSGIGSLVGPGDFTYAAPAIAAVEINGGPDVALPGGSISLAGQNSVVKQIKVTFNQAVTLAADAFTLTPRTANVSVVGGASPLSAPVAVTASALSASEYLLTFSGEGTHDGGILNSGIYDLTTLAANVTAHGEPMSANRIDPLFALFGTVDANNTYSPAGLGNGQSRAFVDPGSLFQFSDTFGSSFASPSGIPLYNPIFDSNLDGAIDPGDLFAFSDAFGIAWQF